MAMAQRLEIHREIEQADKKHYEGWNRALAESIWLALDMYRTGEIEKEDLSRMADELYRKRVS